MEAESALVGADGAVHLDAETTIDLDIAMVIKPRNAEHQHALGLRYALKNFVRDVFRVTLQYETKGIEYFLDCLVEFGLCRILRLHLGHYFLDVIARSLNCGGRRHNASTHVNSPCYKVCLN